MDALASLEHDPQKHAPGLDPAVATGFVIRSRENKKLERAFDSIKGDYALEVSAPGHREQAPAVRLRGPVVALLTAIAATPVRALASSTDRLRARFLALTLRIGLFDRIFRSRTKRLAAFFSLSFVIALTLALTVPLWVLLVGPLVLGVPHLVASLSFVPRLTGAGKEAAGIGMAVRFGALFIAVAAMRLWSTAPGPAIFDRLPNGVEMAAMLIAGGCLASASGAGFIRSACSAAILSALMAASLTAPASTLGALVLAHNFAGFIYWIARAPTSNDRFVGLGALVLFAAATVAILAGVFDAALTWRTSSIFGGALDDWSIGQTILPGTDRAIWWSRAVSAFALGQSLHYFVWLRAIPEQELPHQHPIGFSKSLRLLERDTGPAVVYGAAYGLAGLFVYALFKGWPEARLLYLTAAAFHGYFEIAGLALVRRAPDAKAL